MPTRNHHLKAARPAIVAASALLLFGLAVGCGSKADAPAPQPNPNPSPREPGTGTSDAPRLLNVNPTTVSAGTEVTVTGHNLASVSLVRLHGDAGQAAVSPISASATEVRFQVPVMVSGRVRVSVQGMDRTCPGLELQLLELNPEPAPGPAVAPGPVRQVASALAGHQAARRLLSENLACNHEFAARFGGQITNLTTEYRAGRAVLDRFKAIPPRPGEYRINYDYIDADPYLASHNENLHQLFPEEVTDAEWRQMYEALQRTGGATSSTDLAGAFDTATRASAELRILVRKRVLRLFREVEARSRAGRKAVQEPFQHLSPTGELAYELSQQAGRCIDGLQQGLTDTEQLLLGDSQGAPARHLGELISRVVTDYKMAFIRKHAELDPNREFTTYVVQTLEQKMLYSLGLRGTFAPIHYAGMPGSQGPLLESAAVMERFLAGADLVVLDPRSGAFSSFEAFNVDKLISLLDEARTRDFQNPAGNAPLEPGLPGQKLTMKLVRAECIDPAGRSLDPVLGPAWTDFEIISQLSEGNRFFEARGDAQHDTNFKLTRDFWLHVLLKYGYLTRA